jgi:hypothetical protein
MSHFTVLVIGPNVEEQLAPYHEFECTGDNNQYVIDEDDTEDARKTFETHKTTRYRDPEGNLHDPFTPEGNFNQMFWRELTPEESAKWLKDGDRGFYQDYRPTEEHGGLRLYSTDWHDGLPYHTKTFQWPSEGWTEVEVLDSTTRSFAEFCEEYHGHKIVPFGTEPDLEKEHKYGYTLVDEQGNVIKTINRTNPNRKWDWYSVGGRWNGYFKLKPLAMGVVGAPGLQTMDSDYEPVGEGRADILQKGDIDVEGMRDEAGAKAVERYDRFLRVTQDMPVAMTWKQVQERNQTGEFHENGEPKVDWKVAREQYSEQPMVKAMQSDRETMWYNLEEFLIERDAYIQRARQGALATFAVVKDSKWYERGSMGWWGIVSDEEDRDTWYQQFSDLIDSLPDDTLLTIVDCHI